jgi:hypothetical protein
LDEARDRRCIVAIFFFDVLSPDDLVLKDADGLDLPDLEAAIVIARRRADDCRSYAQFGGRPVAGWSIEVKDASGALQYAAPIRPQASASPLAQEEA